jgi:hypothetical protein
MVSANSTWKEAIHCNDPYTNFPIAKYTPDLRGWGSQSPIFDAVISQIRPSHVVEIGSWKGASAIQMADLMAKYGCSGEIVCVDTWLGGPEVWLNQADPNLSVPFEFGRPLIYDQFLANVIHSGHTRTIVPFPVDSITGAKVLQAKGLHPEAIYIDAGHEYEHVSADLNAWWNVLRPGGIMFGDDYHLRWIGVVRAVHNFADTLGLAVNTAFPDKWLIRKSD